ncbi:MAG: MFS transporter [Hyphomonadaceae bacterium JAD_PAG50586_4]|nr:MAG: MFS transporter [Hyphomonadaceae bacterium JAD_PAG50586_4]
MSAVDAVSRRNIGPSATLLYAAGSLGTGVFSTVPTILLLYYCTETLAIPPAWAAAAVAIPKVWSILWDPFVGALSDRTYTRFGRRRPFLILGSLGVFAAFIALFSAPPSTPLSAFIWVSIAYFALATMYSVFAVPYIAVPAELGRTEAERGRMVTMRITGAMVGLLAGASLAPMLVAYGGGGRAGYAFMAVWIAILCLIAMFGPVVMLKGREDSVRGSAGPAPSLLSQLRAAFAHSQFRLLAFSYFLQLSAAGAITALTPYLVTRMLGRGEGDIGVAMGVMLIITIITTPLWGWLGARFGNRAVLALGALAYAGASAAFGFALMQGGDWSAALIGFALMGAPLAAVQVLPFVLMAHLAHAESHGGSSLEGVFTGVWTASEKLGLALGPAIAGLALALTQEDVTQASNVLLIGASPVLFVLSLAPLLAFKRAA